MTASKILVVDDQEAGRFVKVQTLRRAGFTVVESGTGTEALALVQRERPDLAILDVNLPDISGLEVTRRLRASETGPPALQILQVSNTAVKAADRVQGLEQGADVYLTEPLDADVLVATVHALLRVRRAEAELAAAYEGERRAREIAEDASRLKDDFIATLSHELRTPLNALMGWIWQLRHTKLGDKAYERALDSLERNGRMQAQLINDLLDVSRASKGKLRLEMRLVELKSVVLAAAESLKEALAAKHLDLSVDLVPVSVVGDLGRLYQIVTNLLTNAVQFTPEDGRIAVVLSAENDEAVLKVRDTGAGIDPAFLPLVFDQFRQGEGGLSRKHGGLGLGLAVVQQLVDLHGGTVTVTSEGLGHGATFVVRLPKEVGVTDGSDSESAPLILHGVRLQLVPRKGSDGRTLKDLLESSGADVSVPDTDTATQASDTDLVVSESEEGALALRAQDSATRQPPAQLLPASAKPGQVVRQIARFLAKSRA